MKSGENRLPKTVRELIDSVIDSPVRLTLIDVEPKMIHMDLQKDGKWRVVVTKSLMENE